MVQPSILIDGGEVNDKVMNLIICFPAVAGRNLKKVKTAKRITPVEG